jgi:hypothetical protein
MDTKNMVSFLKVEWSKYFLYLFLALDDKVKVKDI